MLRVDYYTFRFTVHTFPAASSSSCASRRLHCPLCTRQIPLSRWESLSLVSRLYVRPTSASDPENNSKDHACNIILVVTRLWATVVRELLLLYFREPLDLMFSSCSRADTRATWVSRSGNRTPPFAMFGACKHLSQSLSNMVFTSCATRQSTWRNIKYQLHKLRGARFS